MEHVGKYKLGLGKTRSRKKILVIFWDFSGQGCTVMGIIAGVAATGEAA